MTEKQLTASPDRSELKDGLGDFFTETMLAAAMFDGELKDRAYHNYCPKCGSLTLKLIHRNHDIATKTCNSCDVLVVLKDT